MEFRPCIDLHAGIVKQIVGSTLIDDSSSSFAAVSEAEPQLTLETNFESSKPAEDYAKLYASDGLVGGHLIMLGASEANRCAAKKALESYPKGLQVGGGVTAENAKKFLEWGASHVIVTSYVFRDGTIDFDRLSTLVEMVGKHRLVLDLSCRRNPEKKDDLYYVVTDRWQTFTNVALSLETLQELAAYCDEFLVHAVDVEGKKCGIQDDLVVLLGCISPIPVTYAGGVHSMLDLERVQRLGKNKVHVSIGSALDIFGGHLSYRSIVDWFQTSR